MPVTINNSQNSVTITDNNANLEITDNNTGNIVNITGVDVSTVTVADIGPKGDKGDPGEYVSGSSPEFHSINASGNISSSGGTITAGQFVVDGKLSHANDANTELAFSKDTITLKANNQQQGRFGSNNLQLGNPANPSPVFITASTIDVVGTVSSLNLTTLNLGSGGITLANQESPGDNDSFSVVQFSETDETTLGAANYNMSITGDITMGGNLNLSGSHNRGHITASGNISASGKITALSASFSNLSGNSPLNITSTITNVKTNIVFEDDINIYHNAPILNQDDNNVVQANASDTTFGSSLVPTKIDGNITASGDISSSGTITANKIESDNLFNHVGDANTGVQLGLDTVTLQGNDVNIGVFATNRVELNKPVTASGDISASGNITADGSLRVNTFDEGIRFFNGTNYTSNRIELSTAQNLQIQVGGAIQALPTTNFEILAGKHLQLNNDDNSDNIRIHNGAGTLAGSSRLDFEDSSNGVKMSISSSGNVGIGTTTPSQKLDVSGNIRLGDGGSGANIDFNVTDRGVIKVSGAEVMRISASGDVGINTIAPAERLHVIGNITSSGKITVGADGNGSDFKVFGDKANTFMQYDASEEQLTIKHPRDQAGLTIFTTESATPTGGGQIRVGRDAGQYIGLKTLDRDAHFIHRQDETDHGQSRTHFEIWDSSHPSKGSHHWTFRSADGSGGNLATRMLISSSGNVGIGTTSPSARLHLSGSDSSAESAIRQSRAGRGIWDQAIDSSGRLQWGYRAADSEGGTRTITFTLDDNNRVAMGFGHAPDKLLHISGSGGDTAILLEKSTNDATIESRTNGAGAYFRANSVGSANYYGFELNNDTTGKWFIGSYGYADLRIVDGDRVSGTAHVTIKDTTGNVGIGTTSPGEKLTVDTGYILSTGSSTSHGFQLSRDGLDSYRIRHLDGGLTIQNSTDNRKEMTFDGTGKVGIGITSPAAGFHVSSSEGTKAIIEGDNGSTLLRIRRTDQNAHFDISLEGNDLRFNPSTLDNSMNVLFGVNNGSQKVASRVGIGEPSPKVELHVSGAISSSGDIFAGDTNASGVILTSPGGSRFRLQVDNSGNLSTTSV